MGIERQFMVPAQVEEHPMFRELRYIGWDFVKPVWKVWIRYDVTVSNTVGQLEKVLDGLLCSGRPRPDPL